MLSLLPILRFAVESTREWQRFVLERASFQALCRLLSAYQSGKNALPVADALAAATDDHAQKKRAAYWGMPGIFVYKDHQSKHLAAQLAADGELMDTLVCERYHNISKLGMEHIDNTNRMEATALARICLAHSRLLREGHAFQTGLIG